MPTKKPTEQPTEQPNNPTKAFNRPLKSSERLCYWDWGVRDSGKSTEYKGQRLVEDGHIRVECTVCGCVAQYQEQEDGTPTALFDIMCSNVAKCKWKPDAGLRIAQIIIDKDAVTPNVVAENSENAENAENAKGCSGGMGGKDDGNVDKKHPSDTFTSIL